MTELEERELKERFLEEFIERRGDRSEALKVIGVARKTFFRWLDQDKAFLERYDKTRLLLADDVENAAIARVMKGKSSDNLLKTLLGGLKPERYREGQEDSRNQTVVYISGMRDDPRPGVEVQNVREYLAGTPNHHLLAQGVQDPGGDGAPAQGDDGARAGSGLRRDASDAGGSSEDVPEHEAGGRPGEADGREAGRGPRRPEQEVGSNEC